MSFTSTLKYQNYLSWLETLTQEETKQVAIAAIEQMNIETQLELQEEVFPD